MVLIFDVSQIAIWLFEEVLIASLVIILFSDIGVRIV